MKTKIGLKEILGELPTKDGNRFLNLMQSDGIEIEIYEPKDEDLQQPHDRDEIYFVARGSGQFELEDEKIPFDSGDLIYVEARKKHRFAEFSDDFATWVLFFGAKK